MDLSLDLLDVETVPMHIPTEMPEAIPAHAGYGACSVSGCHCQAYQGQDNTCMNCGHNYQMHW